mmetsp:Transcript_20829/g.40852  ORF Transcript_20829/g.40852 Transcript_20829/m.40852 type:complete len:272 (+) Transcript_20829:299-1114(+)
MLSSAINSKRAPSPATKSSSLRSFISLARCTSASGTWRLSASFFSTIMWHACLMMKSLSSSSDSTCGTSSVKDSTSSDAMLRCTYSSRAPRTLFSIVSVSMAATLRLGCAPPDGPVERGRFDAPAFPALLPPGANRPEGLAVAVPSAGGLWIPAPEAPGLKLPAAPPGLMAPPAAARSPPAPPAGPPAAGLAPPILAAPPPPILYPCVVPIADPLATCWIIGPAPAPDLPAPLSRPNPAPPRAGAAPWRPPAAPLRAAWRAFSCSSRAASL